MINKISFLTPFTVSKKWGKEIIYINNDSFCCKELIFDCGRTLSLHSHVIKHELFILKSGSVIFRYHDYDDVELKERKMLPGDMVYIPQFNFHSVEALENSVILEISSHHEDSDSYRLTKSK